MKYVWKKVKILDVSEAVILTEADLTTA